MGLNGEKSRMGMKILIVEDDISTRKLEEMILQRAGYCIIEAENGLAATQVLDVQRIDVILLDIVMPEMNGIEFLSKLKSNPITATIPVILCTSVSEEDYVQKAVSLGINGYILKPINAKDLLQKVQQVMKNIEPVLEDPRKTTSKLGLDFKEYRQLLTLLVDDGKQRLKSIGRKVEVGNFKDFYLFTRDLSSSAENLGANALHRAALEASAFVPKANKKVREKYFLKIRSEIERLGEAISGLA